MNMTMNLLILYELEDVELAEHLLTSHEGLGYLAAWSSNSGSSSGSSRRRQAVREVSCSQGQSQMLVPHSTPKAI